MIRSIDKTGATDYVKAVVEWVEKARASALQEVNTTHDREAPRYNTKRSEALFYLPGELVLEWRPIFSEGSMTKL